MQHYLVANVLGSYQAEQIGLIFSTIKDCGCSVREARMTTLGDEFAISTLIAGTWDSIAKAESSLEKLQKKYNLQLQTKRTEPRTASDNLMPYAIDVVSFDHIGVVYELTQFITKSNIKIQDLSTSTYTAAHTATPMFSLHMTVNIPTDVSIASLRGEFMDFCDKLNLDAILEPVK